MKRIIAIIFAVVCLTGLVIWEQITVNAYLTDIYEITEQLQIMTADDKTINTTLILEKVEQLERVWDEHENILCMIANHKDMQDLSIEIEKMKANVEMNQYEDFQASLNVIMFLSEAYHHFMGVSFQNIF